MLAGLLLSLLVAQVPCVPSDSTAVCSCKQGSASACAALADTDAELVKGLLRMHAMSQAGEKGQESQANTATAVDTGCGQPPDNGDDQQCTGQQHHIISMAIFRALESRSILKGLYRYRDPRFVTQAKDVQAHCGYQKWHKELDDEIAGWIKREIGITPEKFEAYLRDVYNRPELKMRFPNGF